MIWKNSLKGPEPQESYGNQKIQCPFEVKAELYLHSLVLASIITIIYH